MKLSRIFGAIFILILLHLTLFVSCSTIQRSLSDDIRNGISIAGKILGVDSPTNIAVISNVAELVARAFSKNTQNNQQNHDWDRRQLITRPSEHLEDFGEVPQSQNNHHVGSNEQNFEQSVDDNVIIGMNGNPGSTTSTTEVDHGFLGQVLRILGMDSNKIGALAINGIIFIAQMIGRSFLSAFTNMAGKMGTKPNESINGAERSRRFDTDDSPKEFASVWDNALGWVADQSKLNPYLSQQIETMLDKSLPDRIINMVDDGDIDGISTNEKTHCIKQLLCKTAPFIWSMQKAVSAKINKSDIQTNGADDSSGNDAKNTSVDDDYRLKAFSKYLPTADEFTSHGATCENQYAACKLF